MATTKVTQYFTFLTNHVHPKTGEPMADKYIAIIGNTAEECREEMFKRYGDKWGFQYSEEPKKGDFLVDMKRYETIDLTIQPAVQLLHVSYDQFFEEYIPKLNPVNNYSSFNGALFETYGEEYEMVKRAAEYAPNTVWTLVDDEDDGLRIAQGFHLVNRVGYFITQNPAPEDKLIEDIPVDDNTQELAYPESDDYLVAYVDDTDGIQTNEYTIFHDSETNYSDALKMYNELTEKETSWTVQLCKIIKSTDHF